MLTFKDLEGQVARQFQQLQEYHFQILHCKEISHRNADGLSQRPCKLECKQCRYIKKSDVHIQKLMLMQLTEWRQEQLDDDDIGPILRAKEQDTLPGWADISKWDALGINQGTLYCVWESENDQNEYLQVVVLRCSVPRILHNIYDFLVDTLELRRELPNFVNNFTCTLKRSMCKIGLADV